jgi:hypothetical protein
VFVTFEDLDPATLATLARIREAAGPRRSARVPAITVTSATVADLAALLVDEVEDADAALLHPDYAPAPAQVGARTADDDAVSVFSVFEDDSDDEDAA